MFPIDTIRNPWKIELSSWHCRLDIGEHKYIKLWSYLRWRHRNHNGKFLGSRRVLGVGGWRMEKSLKTLIRVEKSLWRLLWAGGMAWGYRSEFTSTLSEYHRSTPTRYRSTPVVGRTARFHSWERTNWGKSAQVWGLTKCWLQTSETICAEEAAGFHKIVKMIHDPVTFVVPCAVIEIEFLSHQIEVCS